MKHYPRLRIGKYKSVIVSDHYYPRGGAPMSLEDMKKEEEHYGGLIVAESMPAHIAEKMVQIWNEYFEGEEIEKVQSGGAPLLIGDSDVTSIDFQIDFIRNKAMAAKIDREKGAFNAILENLMGIKQERTAPKQSNLVETPTFYSIKDSLKASRHTLAKIAGDAEFIDAIESAAQTMAAAIKAGKKIIAFGNGGSMSDAQHFVAELVGRYNKTRRALPAIALSDSASMSCIANDFSYDEVFERQLSAIMNDGDVILALSTSGASRNVVQGAMMARLKYNNRVISITGSNDSPLKAHSSTCIQVPHSGTADRIQEVTICVIHALVKAIEELLDAD